MSTKGERNRRRREREKQQRAAQRQKPAINPAITVTAPTTEPGQVDSTNNSTAQPGADDEPHRPDPQPRERWWHGWNWKAINAVLTLIFAAALVAFTAFQVYYGMLQWDATDKQWQAMTEQLELTRIDQRAWLSHASPKISDPVVGQPMSGVIAVSNSGKTPGRIVGEFCFLVPLREGDPHAKVTDTRTELDINFPKYLEAFHKQASKTGSQMVVPPGATQEYGIQGQTVLTKKLVKEIKDGDMMVFVFVYIEYVHGTKAKGTTCQCFIYVPDTGECTPYTKYNHMD